MAYLFDTNAISESFRPRPNPRYVSWLRTLPRDQQLTSIVVIAELYTIAFRGTNRATWRHRIEELLLPTLTVLSFDLDCARECGRLDAELRDRGTPIDTADLQIAATALVHGLTVVTANRQHFERVPGLSLEVFKPGFRQADPPKRKHRSGGHK